MIKKITSTADLYDVKLAYDRRMEGYTHQILVCAGAGCVSCGCADVCDAVKDELELLGLTDKVCLKETGCMGICAVGPVMLILPERTFYVGLNSQNVRSIIRAHIVEGHTPLEYTYFDNRQLKHIPCIDDIPFFKNQVRIALRNCGEIEYASLESYIAKGGYQAACKALTAMTPDEVTREVLDSGLRGRGGAGFPTGRKWSLIDKKVTPRYIICNADEGDPGAFMDRSVIEGDPHNLIEGMIIGGYAVGANHGFVYIRAEYPIAVERLTAAIGDARAAGLLGHNLFGSGFDFDIEIRIGAGAFVCGEETALMSSVEGHRGEPRQKPPFPATSGLFKKPTIINNVETLANVAYIIGEGADKYASYGSDDARGTKVFALAGDIINTGIIEVPIGTPLRKIIYEIGGGMRDDKKFKAAQVGGPSGGCVTAENLDVPMEYGALSEVGAIMGSGGLIVMDEETCMVDTARFFMDFIKDESCGKCVACRLGTKRMLEILKRITRGEGRLKDIDTLEELAGVVKDAAMCGLGQTAPNPVLSTLRSFRSEYVAHVVDRKCPAGVCTELAAYKIDPLKCKGCSACSRACPAEAITGVSRKPFVIDMTLCVKCGNCYSICRFDAIIKE